MTKRTMVRVASFCAAGVLALGGVILRQGMELSRYQRMDSLRYMQALQEVSSRMNNIRVDLEKSTYAGTPAQVSAISAKILKESGTAKAAFSSLPVSGELRLDNTYRFLSQVGDYSMYLARKAANQQEITTEERDNLTKLLSHAKSLNSQLGEIELLLRSGQLRMEDLLSGSAPVEQETQTKGSGELSGFQDVEDGMQGYPTLIYDGPFSDNLMEREPMLTPGLPLVDVAKAKENAAKYLDVSPDTLAQGQDEDSKMPSYTFQNDSVRVGVTKNGGIVTYFMLSRDIGEEVLEQKRARELGMKFLQSIGIENMQETYYEVSGGICTINYAYTQNDVVCYTDLIKVGVSMDNGQVVFYDARGYINNHKERQLPEPTITTAQAQESVSPRLRVQNIALALIPTQGKNEVLTYEFKTKGQNDENILVYVNVETGAEEQILVLLESENGVLTM